MLDLPAFNTVLSDRLQLSPSELASFALGFARALPVIIFVPAFGLRAIPATGRVLFALILGIAAAPALVPLAQSARPWLLALTEEFIKGLPLGLGTAAVLWSATMAGNLIDTVRGVTESRSLAVVENGATLLGNLFSLFASLLFLRLGGPAHLVSVLADPDLGAGDPLLRACFTLLHSIEIGIAIATPFVVVAVVLDAALGLMARAAIAEDFAAALVPLRSLAILLVLALSWAPLAESLASHLRLALNAGSHS